MTTETEVAENPPAFPQSLAASAAGDVYHSEEIFSGAGGMTLRDWFAGQALAQVTRDVTAEADAGKIRVAPSQLPTIIAKAAYQIADAMLIARATKEPRK